MNTLLIGSGGREHALAWKIAQSDRLGKFFAVPGNPGIADHAECVQLDVSDHAQIVAFCKDESIDLVVVGPEAPLVAGLADDLRAAGIPCFGASKDAAQLEGSKAFTKEICDLKNIPTAGWARFNNAPKAKAYLRSKGAPIVIKADGLAAGKGVTVAETVDQACAAVDDCFEGLFGSAGAEVVVEDFLSGEEASFFCLCDGRTAVALAGAQDHKRVGDGDVGPNTGGMGAYSPAPVLTDKHIETVMTRIIQPTLDGMAERGTPFTGVLYAGLMIDEEGPKLIEYNVRFGDPECQVLMVRLKSDLLPVLHAAALGRLAECEELEWTEQPALTVVMAAEGYPGTPKKGGAIAGLNEAAGEGVTIFHAGTALKSGQLVASGGRVLNVTANGATLEQARERAYGAIERIDWPDGFYRSDIAWRALKREG
ncbi:phosphoribosylamine--glycine ligase [Notoacmeibacter ruber]|uniref:Phosphoribosylamine--glycine ligase n=1 Tax=Notoacmeibacter ruber TaxID=2670375 RepID=A0A3L7JFY0_9HYPH|nr:phosphoribosylamine--glycine ligase [Notoacmeibacter ruber]RLQ89374.1 phosphoribosylamine--glycine ligase [Notoacmeibacter ruber]